VFNHRLFYINYIKNKLYLNLSLQNWLIKLIFHIKQNQEDFKMKTQLSLYEKVRRMIVLLHRFNLIKSTYKMKFICRSKKINL